MTRNIRRELAAYLRLYAPSAAEREKAPAACRPFLDAMSDVTYASAIAQLADEIERAAAEPEAKPDVLAVRHCDCLFDREINCMCACHAEARR